MNLPAPAIMAIWGLFNVALLSVLAGFGAKPAVVGIYAASAALVELFAFAVWRRHRHRGGGRRHLPSGDSIPLVAAGIVIVGLGFAFYWPLAITAVVPFVLAFMRESSVRGGKA
jgi:hypothetical protein